MICSGDAAYWPGDRCAVVTELVTHPKCIALNIWLMGGDLRELRKVVIPRIEDFAVTNGISALYGCSSRPGMVRIVNRMGYETASVNFVKDLR